MPGFNRKTHLLTSPTRDQFTRTVSEPTLLYEGDRLLLALLKAPEGWQELLGALRSIDFKVNNRTAGMRSQSRTFAFMPRRTLRNDYCSRSILAEDDPDTHKVLLRWGQKATREYQAHNPEEFQRSQEAVATIRPEWVIPGSVFTSGIANQNNPLRYHVDAGNFPQTWSAMFAFAHDVQGGEFVLPEFQLALDFQFPALVMFEGQHEVHGVLPIRKLNPRGYRLTCVYYALRGMCKCGSLDDELQRIRTVRLSRELKRAGKLP